MYRHGTHRSPYCETLAAYTYISGFSRVCVCVADYIKSLSQRRCHVAAAALWLVPEQTGGEERRHYLHAEECLVPHHAQQPQVQQRLKAQRDKSLQITGRAGSAADAPRERRRQAGGRERARGRRECAARSVCGVGASERRGGKRSLEGEGVHIYLLVLRCGRKEGTEGIRDLTRTSSGVFSAVWPQIRYTEAVKSPHLKD
ncbi:hypothetical protein Q8A67_016454 [Cirrhinus molitorella]|uniref:Uncharacterized protein n=1 Tax=Cirrhinus molitorella TaxID=172907 RepID=A0AA88TJ72_9TELE|nr:hypothetical protein Q8A67_016454 [Cirrhinus molitorella]